MTTENPDAVALVKDALDGVIEDPGDFMAMWDDGYAFAAAILAHPRLARVVALGLAWVRAEEALPSGWSVFWLRGIHSSGHWTAEAIEHNGWRTGVATGPDPEAALIALAEKIGGSK